MRSARAGRSHGSPYMEYTKQIQHLRRHRHSRHPRQTGMCLRMYHCPVGLVEEAEMVA